MRTHRAIAMPFAGLLLGIAGVWFLSNGSHSVVPGWRTAAGAGESVLVLVDGSPAKVAGVERQVSADRILASSSDGFALREGLLVVSSIERAGTLLMRAGWRDKPIEIVAAQRAPKAAESGSTAGNRMTELMNKPTLTLAEARGALDAM